MWLVITQFFVWWFNWTQLLSNVLHVKKSLEQDVSPMLSILPPPFRSSLQSVRDAISNQVSAVFQLYEENTDSLDLLTVTERSVTAPSLSDMLEWLQDAERHYREQYPFCSCSHWVGFSFYSGSVFPQVMFRFLRRKTLLQTLRADDLSLLESAPKRWKSFESPSAEDRITGIMSYIMLIPSLTCHSPQITDYYIWQVNSV